MPYCHVSIRYKRTSELSVLPVQCVQYCQDAIDNSTLRCTAPPMMSYTRENAVTVVGQRFKPFTVPDDTQNESVSVIVNASV